MERVCILVEVPGPRDIRLVGEEWDRGYCIAISKKKKSQKVHTS